MKETCNYRKEIEPNGDLMVMKFGGTSVGNAERIGEVSELVLRSRNEGKSVVVVTSAMAGVTDLLDGICDAMRVSGFAERNRQLEEVTQLHEKTLKQLVLSPNIREETNEILQKLLVNQVSTKDKDDYRFGEGLLADVINGSPVGSSEWLEPALGERILSYGERLSALLLSAALQSKGLRSEAIDARSIIKTTPDFGHGKIVEPHTHKNIRRTLQPIIDDHIIPIVTGFIASSLRGETVTLGRGGSDYTAAILARSLHARELWIWTDVDGVFTSDPRINPESKLIEHMTFDDADRMAKDGHKVLCPRTMDPLLGRNITVRIKNALNPSAPGTEISPC